MQFPPPRRSTAHGGTRPQTAPPPPRRVLAELDPVPFPGGIEAALEFAAFEKGLLEGGGNGVTAQRTLPDRAPIERRTPISEPNRDSARWMLAGAGMAAAAAILLLGLGLLRTGFATVLQAMAQH